MGDTCSVCTEAATDGQRRRKKDMDVPLLGEGSYKKMLPNKSILTVYGFIRCDRKTKLLLSLDDIPRSILNTIEEYYAFGILWPEGAVRWESEMLIMAKWGDKKVKPTSLGYMWNSISRYGDVRDTDDDTDLDQDITSSPTNDDKLYIKSDNRQYVALIVGLFMIYWKTKGKKKADLSEPNGTMLRPLVKIISKDMKKILRNDYITKQDYKSNIFKYLKTIAEQLQT